MPPYLIVISLGRSGSTLLQALLNENPACLIRGENNNFFYHLFKAYEALMNAEDYARALPDASNHPWFGFHNYSTETFLDSARQLGINFLLGNNNSKEYSTIGFKEIRFFSRVNDLEKHSSTPLPELEDYLRFLQLLFPGVKFVCIKRKASKIVHSSIWKHVQNKKSLMHAIRSFYSRLEDLTEDLDISWIALEELRIDNIRKLRRKFKNEMGIFIQNRQFRSVLGHELTHAKSTLTSNPSFAKRD